MTVPAPCTWTWQLADLGGPGPSLGMLYQDGNSYIQANASWKGMAETSRVVIVEQPERSVHREL